MSPSYGAPATCASVIPYPASVVGVVVKSVNATLCNALAAKAPCAEVAASVIPYPASVVGLPVKLTNVCAGTLVKYPTTL